MACQNLRPSFKFSIGISPDASCGSTAWAAQPHCRTLMAQQIVHYDDVAGLQFGHKNLGHVSLEPIAVDRAIQYHWRDHAGHAQSGDQRGGLAVLVGEPSAVARLSAAPMASGHVGGGPGFINEGQAFRFEINRKRCSGITLPGLGAVVELRGWTRPALRTHWIPTLVCL